MLPMKSLRLVMKIILSACFACPRPLQPIRISPVAPSTSTRSPIFTFSNKSAPGYSTTGTPALNHTSASTAPETKSGSAACTTSAAGE